MAKEVFVEDEEADGGEAPGGEHDILKQLHKRCQYLEALNKVRTTILLSWTMLIWMVVEWQ